MTPTIDSFTGDFAFLSNFHPCEIEFEGIKFPTVEHAFQAAKTLSVHDREAIRAAATPGKAKRLGRKVDLRRDWNNIRVSVMEQLLRIKFSDPWLRELLDITKGATLVEGNTWNDTFWGVCKGKGDNNLGKLLMKIRDERHV